MSAWWTVMRKEPALHLVDPLAEVGYRLMPSDVFTATARTSDFTASNVPGVPIPVWIAGAKVRAMYPLTATVGAATNITLLSYAGNAGIGISMDDAAITARVERLVAALGMQDFIDRRTEGFSQGQRTKTAIARALVHDPRNVLLDEPTNGLDVMTTRALRRFLAELKAEGRCVLFSSHIMQEVAALCDRIVVIAHGRVVAQGTADELRAQTGRSNLEDAFVQVIGSEEGLFA